MTEKKANTDPTFPAPPPNPQSAPPSAPAGAAPVVKAPIPNTAEIDDMLDSLGKAPEPGKKKRRAVPEPSEAAAVEPHEPPARLEHATFPNSAVIVREPTQQGLGDSGLNVTPEERARLDALMRARAEARAVEGEFLAPGDRDVDTESRRIHNKPPPVTTDSRTIPRKSIWPAAAAVVVAAAVLIVIILHSTAKTSSSATATTTSATTTTTATATTTVTATTTEITPVPTIPTTNVENLPSPTAHPTGRPVHSATTAASTASTHATTAATTTTSAPPPPGMNLLPDDPHK